MASWSLNIFGDTEDGDALEAAITDAVAALGAAVAGGSLNLSDRPQVSYAPAAEAPQEAAGDAAATPPSVVTPEGVAAAEADPAAAGETLAEATPLGSYSVQELEDELNRRSGEGPNITSDGTVLQESTPAAIEAEISSRGVSEDSSEDETTEAPE